ncbi:MAG TPA: hypothetical protein VNA25_28130 [Phycisphaerae bacterium]|nr:hypothetical protein [Phycisphaerae bacterium]
MTEVASESRPRSTVSLGAGSDELFRGLWASVFHTGKISDKHVLICSADRWEGASTVACGLALAGGDPAGDARVALVDFNLRYPAIHRLMGLPQGPGVCEVILKNEPTTTVARSISRNLDVYTVGNLGARALDALRSPGMSSFLSSLGQTYDHVLFDAAPANLHPDAKVLAGAVKDVIMVIRTDQTPREAVAQAKRVLESGGGRVVGVVLNMRTFPLPRFLYRRV